MNLIFFTVFTEPLKSSLYFPMALLIRSIVHLCSRCIISLYVSIFRHAQTLLVVQEENCRKFSNILKFLHIKFLPKLLITISKANRKLLEFENFQGAFKFYWKILKKIFYNGSGNFNFSHLRYSFMLDLDLLGCVVWRNLQYHLRRKRKKSFKRPGQSLACHLYYET